MRKILKRILRLIVAILIGLFIVKATTFGWRFWSKSSMSRSDFVAQTSKGEGNAQLIKNLKSHVYKLSHEIGDRSMFKYDKLEEAKDYIAGEFTSFGYNVEFQKYTLFNKTAQNIIASKVGINKPEEIVIVGAHYDTCFNPGADDNGSAVAGLLQLARFMSNKEAGRTIKFIAFVNEEPPFFKTKDMGSYVYVREAKAKGENIKAVIILEMIGYYTNKPNSQRYPPFLGLFYPNKGNFICAIGNFPSRELVKEVIKGFKKQAQFPIESFTGPGIIQGVDFSDHWSFWKEGYPAVMVTDTAFYRNPHYHSSSDTYEKLNYESMAEVIRGLKVSLTEISH